MRGPGSSIVLGTAGILIAAQKRAAVNPARVVKKRGTTAGLREFRRGCAQTTCPSCAASKAQGASFLSSSHDGRLVRLSYFISFPHYIVSYLHRCQVYECLEVDTGVSSGHYILDVLCQPVRHTRRPFIIQSNTFYQLSVLSPFFNPLYNSLLA